jgi:hypothetical protein
MLLTPALPASCSCVPTAAYCCCSGVAHDSRTLSSRRRTPPPFPALLRSAALCCAPAPALAACGTLKYMLLLRLLACWHCSITCSSCCGCSDGLIGTPPCTCYVVTPSRRTTDRSESDSRLAGRPALPCLVAVRCCCSCGASSAALAEQVLLLLRSKCCCCYCCALLEVPPAIYMHSTKKLLNDPNPPARRLSVEGLEELSLGGALARRSQRRCSRRGQDDE